MKRRPRRQPLVIHTGPVQPLVDPAVVAEALGASIVDAELQELTRRYESYYRRVAAAAGKPT